MYKNTDKRYTVPMKNAEASVRMEGCQVTSQMREQCQRALRGEVTTAELLRRLQTSREVTMIWRTASIPFRTTATPAQRCW